MRIAIIAPGSRGDVQPYVALGKGLKDAGNTVRLVSNQNYDKLVTSHGLDFWPVEADIQDIIQNERMREVLEKGSLLASMAQMAKEMKGGALRLAKSSLEACVGMDMVLAGIGGAFVGLSIAEKLELPFLQAYNVPFTPTQAFPGALVPRLPSWLGGSLNRLSHHLTRQMVWQAYRPADRVVRGKLLGTSPTSFWGPFHSDQLRHGPIIYGFSPSVLPPPPDWDTDTIHVTGYWNLEPAGDWHPPADLSQFLEAGPPPIYIGFGSMSNRKPGETADIVLQALTLTNQRAILFSGWSGLQKTAPPDSVFMVDSVPHSWLFEHVGVVVHHGGAGTTAAGLRAGIPSVIIPYHGDQPFWGQRIADLGVGPEPLPRSKLTAEKLALAIQSALTDKEMRQKAATLGEKIRSENGVARAVEIIQQLRLASQKQ